MFMKDISLVPKTVAQLIKVRNSSNNGWKSSSKIIKNFMFLLYRKNRFNLITQNSTSTSKTNTHF